MLAVTSALELLNSVAFEGTIEASVPDERLRDGGRWEAYLWEAVQAEVPGRRRDDLHLVRLSYFLLVFVELSTRPGLPARLLGAHSSRRLLYPDL